MSYSDGFLCCRWRASRRSATKLIGNTAAIVGLILSGACGYYSAPVWKVVFLASLMVNIHNLWGSRLENLFAVPITGQKN